jgi:hypothetical protein
MQGSGAAQTLTLWRRLLDDKVPAHRRADVAYIALELAELAGCLPDLERVLEDMNMTESTVHNRTLALGEAKGRLSVQRANLLTLLDARFPGGVPEEYLAVIREQESFPLLEHWFQVAAYAKTVEDFLAEMRK